MVPSVSSLVRKAKILKLIIFLLASEDDEERQPPCLTAPDAVVVPARQQGKREAQQRSADASCQKIPMVKARVQIAQQMPQATRQPLMRYRADACPAGAEGVNRPRPGGM
jgi:hypothetical protein